MLTNGWWALTVWRRFGNPFYPLFNNVFRSPFAAPIFRLDPRWGVQQRVDWLRPPIDAALGFHERLQEVPFRDPRLLLPFLALLLWLFVSLARRNTAPLGRPARRLLTFWFVCYVTWLGAFYYYRYGSVLELLAPLVALLLLREVFRERERLALAAALLALVLVLATNVNQWGRGPWKNSWFLVRVPELGRGRAQLVVLRDVMLSFAAPYFPPDSSFVGIALPYGPATDRLIRARIDGHRGPLLLLARTPVVDDRAVSGFGLTLAGSCEPVRTGTIGRLTLCPLARVDPRAP
jgi:hypothetical protein